MGSGKTTLGKKLAPLCHLPFLDLDVHIAQNENQSIQAIFETRGEAAFRKLEAHYLRDISAQRPSVISLGGGTVCFENNLEWIKDNGLLVYLELPASVLADRLLQARQERPLFKGLDEPEFILKVKELLDQRLVYYQQAHLTVKGLNLTPKRLHAQIVECIQK